MDTIKAFKLGQENKDKELMVFDWDKAAQLIKDSKSTFASAGLCGDWGSTGGDIFRDGIPLNKEETYTYLASTWAVPALCLEDGNKIDCYKMQSETPNWDAGTFWPDSALKILSK